MPTTYAEIAADLHRVADTLAALPAAVPMMHVSLSVTVPWQLRLGAGARSEPENCAVVDAVASAVLGRPAVTDVTNSGRWLHRAEQTEGPVAVMIYCEVADPAEVERRAEVEALRAEVERLRAAAPGRPYEPTKGDGEWTPMSADDESFPGACRACNSLSRTGATVCGNCGSPLPPPEPPAEQRPKTILMIEDAGSIFIEDPRPDRE